MQTFEEFNLSPEILRAINELGYTTPSPIQAETLPLLLSEPKDFLGLAATGTGKTAAFGIPALEKIDPAKKTVQVIVLCPTRELALQVSGQIDLLGKHKSIRSVAIYGGASYGDQIRGLKSGAQIVVGTPGRVIDHIEKGTLRLEDIRIFILDEADEMISMGFKEEIEKILESVPREESKIWLFSATMDREVRKVADKFLKDPAQVQVNQKTMLSATVEQFYYMTREPNKPEVLCKLIDAADEFYGLVFCQTKELVINLTTYLSDRGYKADCLHGDKSQDMRERTMRSFRERRVNIMVCTDVASRGLDVKDITHVINFSIPRELDNYVHRIGRTARSGKKGIAMSLVTSSHLRLIGQIERLTKSRMVEGRIPSRRDIAAKKVLEVLNRVQAQSDFKKPMELLGDKGREIIANMPADEVVGRFLAMMIPDVFAEAERVEMPASAVRHGERSRDREASGPGASSSGRRYDRPRHSGPASRGGSDSRPPGSRYSSSRSDSRGDSRSGSRSESRPDSRSGPRTDSRPSFRPDSQTSESRPSESRSFGRSEDRPSAAEGGRTSRSASSPSRPSGPSGAGNDRRKSGFKPRTSEDSGGIRKFQKKNPDRERATDKYRNLRQERDL